MNKLQQQQQRHALHRRQRLPPVLPDDASVSVSVALPGVALPTVKVPGRPGAAAEEVDEEEEEEEDNGGTLSAW